MTEKSQVADIDRSIYDIRDAEHDAYRMEAGLTPAIVEKLSKEKNDPAWMEQFRLESLQIYNNMRVFTLRRPCPALMKHLSNLRFLIGGVHRG